MKIINSLVEYLEILKYIRKSEKVFINGDIKDRALNSIFYNLAKTSTLQNNLLKMALKSLQNYLYLHINL